ncbi:Uncharacterised protein [uncultured archaeon]|nr:Uncharacterised protein [uncultured archaeon]
MKKFILILILLVLPGLVSAATTFSNTVGSTSSFYNTQTQFYNPSFQDIYSGADIATYWPQYSESANAQCTDNNDFLVMIPPGGCSPAVVRSDLLADQNVPVFCQLIGAKVNPLIKVSSIKSISFKGNYPSQVAGISFHPAQAAIRSYNSVLGSPTINNLGYVVIILKKQANESGSPTNVSGNLTATMAYDAQNAFGTGSGEYYLETVDETDWQQGRGQASFWQGRGLLRVIDVQGDSARIAVYTSEDQKVSEFNLKVGETSSLFYFPGFYCSAGIQVKLNSLVGEEDKALLNIDGDDVWVVKGSKLLDGRCTVTSVNLIAGTTGNVGVRCPGSSFQLSLLNSLSANIPVSGSDSEFDLYNVSDKVYTGKKSSSSSKEYDWYLAYAGTSQITAGSLKTGNDFIVLIGQDKNTIISQDIYAKLNDAIRGATGAQDVQNLESSLARKLNLDSDKVKIILNGANVDLDSGPTARVFTGLVNPGKELVQSSSPLTQSQIDSAQEYFNKADQSLKELLDTNPSARDAYSTYGEQGIISAMQLIDELNARGLHTYDSRKIELANKFLELYPDSGQASYVRDQLSYSTNYDSSNAFKSVYVNNLYHTISLKQFYAAPLQNRKTSFVITPASGKTITGSDVLEGARFNLSTQQNPPYFLVEDIQPTSVSLDFYNWSKSGYQRTSTRSFQFDSTGNRDTSQKINIDGVEYNILITDTNVKEVAFVSLISQLNTHSEANFSFHIGIEQRSIPINPERAKDISNSLNETIKSWEAKNAQLGELVKTWKAACLVTGLGLQVKNLFGGFTGESLARQEVMKYYKNYCLSNDTVNGAELRTMSKSQCYSALSQNISNDIDCYKTAMNNVNANVGNQTLEQWKANSSNANSAISVGAGGIISTNNFGTFDNVKSYLLNKEIQSCQKASPQFKTSIQGTTNNVLYGIYSNLNANGNTATLAEELPASIKDSAYSVLTDKNKITVNGIFPISLGNLKKVISNSLVNPSSGSVEETFSRAMSGVDDNAKVGISSVKPNGQWILLVAVKTDNTASSSYQERIKVAFDVSSDKTQIQLKNVVETKDLQGSQIIFKENIGKKCNYNYKDARVRFYDSDPNKGMPAVVPFDKQGWYVLVPQSSGGFLSNNVKGYTVSGVPTYYYLCSVGANGIMELRGGDDSCFSNNVNTDATTYGECALSTQDVQRLRSEAESAIRQAAQQYGKKSISISSFGSVGVDAPMTSDGNLPYECEDFMSVDDCKVLYNVCDPVICPSSRCNFGGQTNVPNVIQSGIIGSLVLCSKNFVGLGGDVFVPFCLTGVYAGIDGYISILKAQRDCMAAAANNGTYSGICDEITAVYKCEFFWRQAAPLMQNLIPNLAEYVYTGGQKGFGQTGGGGEYATFQASWDNMQKSLDYFKNTYAVNSFSAVKFGNIEDIGTEYCRNFVGTSIPGSGDILDKLLQPESPYQFYAQFSEIPFTEATVPATSQYKVFYHIYAGKDTGVSYQVYLKNPPSSSYYVNAQRVSVKVGYIAAGAQVSETKDMTLPAGYKELCVSINGREECGFKSVTTDYGLDTLNAAYAKDQANQTNIQTEKECIQGSASVYGLANLNPQAGVETATQPNIALNGIVRVCATENPGKGTNSARWTQVGTCGSDNIKCWLDQNSVKNVVSEVYGATGSIASAQDFIQNRVNTGDGVLTENETSALLLAVRTNISNLAGIDKSTTASNIDSKIQPTLSSVDKLISYAYLDLQQAEALLQKYFLYEKVVKLIIGAPDTSSNKGGTTTQIAQETPAQTDAAAAADIASSSTSPKVSIGSNNIILVNGADSGYVLASAGGDYYLVKKGDAIVARVTKNQPISISSAYSDLSYLNGCTYGGTDLSCSSVA